MVVPTFVLLVGCTNPPQIPQLPRRDVHPIEKVVFPNAIGPKEIRQMFDALNANGKLNRLKPYLYDPSDASLDRIGSLFTEFFFRRALENEGFPAILTQHVNLRHFTELEQWFRKQTPLLSQQMGNAFGNPLFRDAVQIDYKFVAPKWTDLFNELLPDGFGFERVSEAESLAWANDLLAVLNDEEIQQKVLGAASGFERNQLGQSLTVFVASLSKKERREVAGAVAALSTDEKRPLNKIGPLFQALKTHPAGLLAAAFDKLDKEPDLRSEFSNLLFSQSYDAVTTSVLRALATQPLTTNAEKFISIRTAIEEIAGRSKASGTADALLGNLPIYLPTLALSLWLDEVMKSPDNKTLKERLLSKKGMAADLDLSLLPPALDVQIFIKKGDTFELNPDIEKKLIELELNDFASSLKKIANVPGLGNFRYQFTFNDEKVPFSKALEEFVRQCETTRSFGDAGMLARVFFRRILSVPNRERVVKLDSEDWLVWVHGKLLDPDFWPSVHQILFSSRGLLSDNGDTKRLVLSLFEDKPEYVTYLDKLFSDLQVLLELDRAPQGQRSLLSIYLELNSTLGLKEKRGLTQLAMNGSQLVALSETKAKGPLKGFTALLSKDKALATIAHFIADAGRNYPETFFEPFGPWKKYGVEAAAQTHWNLLRATVGNLASRDLALLIQAPIFDFSFSPRNGVVTADDYLWWSRFVEKKGWEGTYDYFFATSSRRTLSDFLTAIQELDESGYLTEIFAILQRIQDERVRAIAAALQTWQQSGELKPALTFLKTLVN